MRVIAGSARSLRLKTPDGMDTRPTTDRIKETLFNIINFDVAGANFLDLFAGSGGIGIEALSRGARYAAFVDNSRKAVNCIKDNLSHTHFEDKSKVYQTDVLSAISMMISDGIKYDVIFADPPYALSVCEDMICAIDKAGILKEDGYIIVEADIKTDFGFVNNLGYELFREKSYKSNKHVFIRKNRVK